jgi:hypothetical protein
LLAVCRKHGPKNDLHCQLAYWWSLFFMVLCLPLFTTFDPIFLLVINSNM